MTKRQERMWAEIKAMVGSRVEMTQRKEGVEQHEVIHGRLEFVPHDVEAEGAKCVLYTKDYPGGVEHNCAILCANVVGAVRQPPEAGHQGA